MERFKLDIVSLKTLAFVEMWLFDVINQSSWEIIIFFEIIKFKRLEQNYEYTK